MDGRRDEKIFSLLAEYDTPGQLVSACAAVRDAGFTRWDAYSPFPVHGIDPAMGIRPTKLPWIVLVAGLIGAISGLTMQVWMNAYDYPWIISGKPLWSVPAFVPVTFELTILSSALTAFFACLVLNLLPDWYHPLFKKRRFQRVTTDRFFIAIEASDARFDTAKTLLENTRPSALEVVEDDRHVDAALPRPVVYGLVVAVTLSLVPLVLIAQRRVARTPTPRLNLISNMDNQYKFLPQEASAFFPDGRAMRPQVAGTVAQGDLDEDDHWARGRTGDTWATSFPPRLALDERTMARGQERFGIYCSPCHGLAGDGDGMVTRRAEQLQEGTWVQPTSLHDPRVRELPVGNLFDVITRGVRQMPSYAGQIPIEDRWAIVLYVEALQRTR